MLYSADIPLDRIYARMWAGYGPRFTEESSPRTGKNISNVPTKNGAPSQARSPYSCTPRLEEHALAERKLNKCGRLLTKVGPTLVMFDQPRPNTGRC